MSYFSLVIFMHTFNKIINSTFVHTASQRSSVLAVLTESELVMLDVSKPAEEVQCGDDTVLRLAN